MRSLYVGPHSPELDVLVFLAAAFACLRRSATRTFDGRTQELIYWPALRTWPAS